MTIQKVIDYVNDIKPHTFSDETLTGWINECEGHIQTEVLCIDISEVVVYEYKKNKDTELIVKAPHDKLYGLYLIAMIDFAHGEYAKYENTMQLYNNALDEYAKWFIRTHTRNDGSYQKSVHGYYLSAFGLAQAHGYVGTESEWLASLKGEQGIQGIQGVKGDKGDTGKIESVSQSDKNGCIKVNDGTGETEFCVYDDTQIKSDIKVLSENATNMQEQIVSGFENMGERVSVNAKNLSIVSETATQALINTERLTDEDAKVREEVGAVRDKASEALTIAKGRNRAICVDTYEQLCAWVVGAGEFFVNPDIEGYLPIGNNILIRQLNVPDLWVYGHLSFDAGVSGYTDEEIIEKLNTDGYFDIGYLRLAQLETQKVDLSEYYDQTQIDKLLNSKIDKKDGYGLSQNNFKNFYKEQLDVLSSLQFHGTVTEEEIDSATLSGLYRIDANGIDLFDGFAQYYYLFVNHESTVTENLIYQYKFANGGVHQRHSVSVHFDATPIVENWTEWESISGGTLNPTIITSPGSSNAIGVEHNQEARLGTLDNLILVFDTIPEIFSSHICFTASDNFAELQIVMNGELFVLKWRGDDVSSNGTFTPVAGTTYEIAFKNINTTSLNNEETSLVVARVGAV